MKVGFFDSGIGGITVLKDAIDLLPDIDYVYYSDNLNAPYGIQPKETVKHYVEDVFQFLLKQKVEAIVIACNTATSVASKELRKKYDLPIIGMEPAVKVALDRETQGRILVLATPLTIKEEKYQNLISKLDQEHIVDSLPLPELVTYAEDFVFEDEIIKPYLKQKLSNFNLKKYSSIVLGCTHFVYYRQTFREILPAEINIYDGNLGTVKRLADLLNLKYPDHSRNKGQIKFFYSGEKDSNNSILNKYINKLAENKMGNPKFNNMYTEFEA